MDVRKDTFNYTYSAKQQREIESIREKYLPPEESKLDQLRRLDKKATKKGTVISTNLSLNALRDTYTERVTSRIMSYYRILPVYGDDIRLKKRREGRE